MSYFYIWGINPLSVALFTNVFSDYEGCLFVLFMVFFAEQKLVSLIRFHFLIFIFAFIILADGSKMMRFMSISILPMFSFRSFIVSNFIQVFNPFWVYFCVLCRKCSNFILSHVVVQFSQDYFLKTLAFLNCIVLLPLS